MGNKKALLNEEALQEFSQTWEVEVDIEINGQVTRVKMSPIQNQPPQPPQAQQPQQNARGNPLQPQPPVPYPWKHKAQQQDPMDWTDELQQIIQKFRNGFSIWSKANEDPDEREHEYEKVKNILDMDQEEALTEVRRIMRDNLYERSVLSKSWKIESNRLAHYKTSPRLFTKRLGDKWKSYYIDIIIDVSDSMFDGSSINNAVQSALNMGRILNKVSKVRVKMFGEVFLTMSFDEFEWFIEPVMQTWNYSILEQQLWWRSRVENNANQVAYVLDNELSMYRSMWYNRSYWGGVTDWTYEIWPVTESFEYMRKQDWDKLIFVIHDWGHWDHMNNQENRWKNVSICGHNVDSHTQSNYREEIREAIKEGIHTQSIGINTDSPEQDYWTKNFVEINNAGQIYGVLVSSLKRMIWES